jgi:hypothetical protein
MGMPNEWRCSKEVDVNLVCTNSYMEPMASETTITKAPIFLHLLYGRLILHSSNLLELENKVYSLLLLK